MEEDVSFGRWLQRRRKALDLTQEELSQRVACSADHIRNLEADRRRPSKEIAERLAVCLEVADADRLAFLRFARGESSTTIPAPLPQGTVLLPWQQPQQVHMNLSAPLTTLIGREHEVVEIVALLQRSDVRLLTLTGPGGVGKTSLARQVAADLRDAFTAGVCIVPLASVREPELVVTSIAQTVGVREMGTQPLLESLQAYVRDKQLLLVLDNFEHLLKAAQHITELLVRAPGLKVLATSRELLRVSGEHIYPVLPLAVPDTKQCPSPNCLMQYPAVALFIQRAQAVKPDFQLTTTNAPMVAEICARVDGLPLAIELAAARIRLLSPQALLERLRQRLTLLAGGPRDLPSRQQTLRNTIDWSYLLLEAGEQALFRRLAVFVGGCTLEAAEAVCNADDDLPFAVLDGLQSLLDKSLLQHVEGPNSGPRFSMLETIREYAVEQLNESGEAELLRRHHAEYYLARAEMLVSKFRSQRQRAWLDRLEEQHEDVWAALQWVSEQGHAELLLGVGATLEQFWWMYGHVNEVHWWQGVSMSRLITRLTSARVKAFIQAGMLLIEQDNYTQAKTMFEQALMLCRELEDKEDTARCLVGLAEVAAAQGQLVRAAQLWGAAETARETSGTPMPPNERTRYEKMVTAARARLDEIAWAVAWREGRAMPLEQAIAYVLAEDADSRAVGEH